MIEYDGCFTKSERDHCRLIPHSQKKSYVWLGVASSRIPHNRNLYHISKTLSRVSIKVLFPYLCMGSASLAEVCFGRTFLWAAFGMGESFRTISVL